MTFTAKDVQALRQSTGAGMMDCKQALEATDGDIEAAKQHLREKGLAASAKRDDRESNQGLVALKVDGNVGAIVKITLKEKIELGDVVRIEAADGNVLESYEHIQGGRGVNAVLVEVSNGSTQLAHDIAVHIAFARPKYLRRDDVPAEVIDNERATLEAITRNEGKPDQAVPKIVEGRLGGFFKDVVLLEQPYAKDDKLSVSQVLDGAEIVKFAQVEIG